MTAPSAAAPTRETVCLCRDCHREMETVYQPSFNGKDVMVLATCKTDGCTFYGVTLAPESHDNLTAEQAEGYREMNRKRKQLFKGAA